ncbi:hypothetical protein A3Q41_01056 [Rhodococcoides fascians]|uniref:Uncharacterized protein n=1 Tax=Rhodococcoides fascians TaxID=1828 RepID=A0A143QH49_RHOFA|nr:hypothetical protein A3Q41_01056 [Rhodococcus fascians]
MILGSGEFLVPGSPEYLQRFRDGLEKLRQTGTAVLYD